MAGRPSTFPLVDRILDGHLEQFLTEHRARGLSYEAIARELYKQFDIDVSAKAVRRWLLREVDGAVALAHAGHRSASAS